MEHTVERNKFFVRIGKFVIEPPRDPLISYMVFRANEEQHAQRTKVAASLLYVLVFRQLVHGTKRLLHGPCSDIAHGR